MATGRDPEFDAHFDSENPTIAASLNLLVGRPLTPSEALWQLDPDYYKYQRSLWIDSRLQIALGKGSLPNALYDLNRTRFDNLCKLVRRGIVVPFVGAGLSIPMGMPSWSDFMLNLARLGGGPKARRAVKEQMHLGQYEEAATHILQLLGDSEFQERYRAVFDIEAPAAGALKLLPQIVRGPIMTTNFDHNIENLFKHGLSMVYHGSDCDDFRRALASSDPVLFKLHGDIKIARSRVLTTSEYDDAYGVRTQLDHSRPIARGLRAAFSTRSLLFLAAASATTAHCRYSKRLPSRKTALFCHSTMPYWNTYPMPTDAIWSTHRSFPYGTRKVNMTS
ncbi:MAG: hypothetical protein HC927_00050 [Deltaproteobacteria bacterium]|nr:hypothetical protein [Deltaproteobacteria bacterium]